MKNTSVYRKMAIAIIGILAFMAIFAAASFISSSAKSTLSERISENRPTSIERHNEIVDSIEALGLKLDRLTEVVENK